MQLTSIGLYIKKTDTGLTSFAGSAHVKKKTIGSVLLESLPSYSAGR
jgi:hypothetical protein